LKNALEEIKIVHGGCQHGYEDRITRQVPFVRRALSKRQILRHLSKCAYFEGKNVAAVVQIRVDAPGTPFWLDVDIKTNSTLRQLDDFLRNIWLECCGHLSSFEIGHRRYVVIMSDDFFGPEPDERSMNTRLSASLPPVGSLFSYEYDFGSTTYLRLKIVAHRQAPSRRESVRLLARNDDPVWPCAVCQQPASALCAYCINADDAFFCEAHVEDHDCGEEAMLPVVNSPRMGVCGYTGGD
jgi:hypothetical protein